MKNYSIIKKFIVVISSFLLFGCSEAREMSDKVYYTAQIREKTAEILSKRYDMKIERYGANMRDKVNLIYIRFKIIGPIPQDKARRMILDSVDELVKQVNEYEPIQPYLENKPFGPENVAIMFLVKSGGFGEIKDPDFEHMGFNQGEIFYKSRNLQEQLGYVQEIRETYDEAKRKIQEENS